MREIKGVSMGWFGLEIDVLSMGSCMEMETHVDREPERRAARSALSGFS